MTFPGQDVVPRTEVMSSHFALNIRLFSVVDEGSS